MIRRILPHPFMTLMLIAIWIMLVNRWAVGSLVFAIMLGIAIPLITAPYWPDSARYRRPGKIPAFLGIVVWDIIKANIAVSRIVLFMPRDQLRPAWISIPLELTQPEAISALAATITLTPGTLTCSISADGRYLLVHCLHAPDPDAVRDEIIDRYESRLLEIFA